MLENRVPARYTELHVQPRNTGIIVPADNSFPLTDFHPISPRLEFIFDHDSDLINRYVLDYFLPFFFYYAPLSFLFLFLFENIPFFSFRRRMEERGSTRGGRKLWFAARKLFGGYVLCFN